MAESIAWEIKSDYIHSLAQKGIRQDNRAMDEYRPIEVIPNYIPRALGSALVRLGATQVLAGVSMLVGQPYPDSPNAGVLMTGCELVPLASPTFEPGPPDENSIELARVVDRGIRESKAIDFEKLCITEGEEVWMVMLDLHVLDYDGNLFDAAELASTTALWNTRIPKYEDGQIIREEAKEKLPISEKPIECTFAKIGNTIMVDPALEEEKALDARVTFATTDKILCAGQKGGSGSFTREEIDYALDMAFKKGKELRKLVKVI
ncbi:MAG: exosome complex protein Rrp42 [Candidatus Diapherotrites archaeon]|nr:exosome complex protein Rrp42 [Candidatus Diapherotrites archaeon]